MATEGKNLSDPNREDLPASLQAIPNGANFRIGLVVSEWNYDITGALLKGAKQALLNAGVAERNIIVKHVPGTYELALGAKLLFNAYDGNEKGAIQGIVAIGSVIQGETKHFDFVCDAAAQGIKDVSLEASKPVIFCVLTDNTHQQAVDRSGGIHGNKGDECAIACLKMLDRF